MKQNSARIERAHLGVALLVSCALGCEARATNTQASPVLDGGAVDRDAASRETEIDGAVVDVPLVHTGLGTLQGAFSGAARKFLGIPYAQPPVGALRFAPPQPMAAWSSSRTADAFGPACPQPSSSLSDPNPTDEDCLYLNVFAPTRVDKPLPVMVFIHGGAFERGGSDQYDGSQLASDWSVVVVTFNYRLGPLGFLAHPALDAARDVPSGDDGIRDQRMALQFVHDHVAAFGGDPQDVTLFGESAGAVSTCVHYVAPDGRSLAQRFVMESGTCVGKGYGVRTRADAEANGNQLANDLCAEASDVLACLREQPAQTLVDWHSSAGVFGPNWGPSVEGAGGVLPDSPDNLIADPNFDARGAIIGTNKNEWDLFAWTNFRFVTSRAMLQSQIEAQFGSDADQVEQQYSADDDLDANEVYTRLMTDILFRCPTRRFARSTSDKGGLIYLYSFEQGASIHGQELDLVFGGDGANPLAPISSPLLSLAMQDYWTHFARTSTPNSPPLLIWPRYQTSSDEHMTLDDPPSVGSALSQSDCDFWDGFISGGGVISLGL